jgi:hypothetical protein
VTIDEIMDLSDAEYLYMAKKACPAHYNLAEPGFCPNASRKNPLKTCFKCWEKATGRRVKK